MPSAPGYKRDYQQEHKTMLARGDRDKHTQRLRARRLAVRKGMVKPHDGKDLDHKTPLSKGGAPLAIKNLRVQSQRNNRSFKRTSSGAMVKGGNK
jgi:hypothetical protein